MSFNKVNNKNLLSVFYKQSIVLGPQEWKIIKKRHKSCPPKDHKLVWHFSMCKWPGYKADC